MSVGVIVKALLTIVIGYLLGGISFGWIVGRIKNVNILEEGSGNPGFTNAWRVLGMKTALLVLAGDALKGYLAVLFGAKLLGDVGMMIGFVSVVFGHSFSYMLHFKGGKGIATAAGALMYISPITLLWCLLIVGVIVGLTKYMSLGSVTVAILCPILLYIDHQPPIVVGVVACAAAYIVYLHRGNIKRLLNGTENKAGSKRRWVLLARIAVYGAGSWGTALAQVLTVNGHDVTLWGRNVQQMQEIALAKENKKYLPGIPLSENLKVTSEWPQPQAYDYLLIGVPTQSQRQLLEAHKDEFVQSKGILINVAKGIETSTRKCGHEVYQDVLGDIKDRYVVLYGPSHAEEFGKNMPTALVAASENQNAAEAVQGIFMNDNVRVYTGKDVVGVELGGALKNIIALAIGMTLGLGYGDNARAALMTRGLAEITRLGVALGAQPYTFLGLTGVGDLIVTCTSEHSRNRRAGFRLGQGQPLEKVLEEMGMVVEGVATTKAAYALAKELDVEMPILEEMYNVLFLGGDVNECTKNLMTRQKKGEHDDFEE